MSLQKKFSIRWRHLYISMSQSIGSFRIRFGRNDGDGAPAVELGAQPIVVEGFVGEQGADGDAGDQRFDADAVVSLTRQQGEARQIAERVDKRDDFGRQTTARSPDCLILSPPLAPAPCWWTRTIVPSIMAYSKSGSPDNALKRLLRKHLHRPAAKAPEDRIPPPKFRMQIPPRRAGAGNPKNRFEKAAVILAAATRIAGLAWKQRRNPVPLRIAQNSSKSRLVSLFRALNQNSP